MSIESNVILVSNDNSVENILKPKLVLLREVDGIYTVDYSSAVKNIKEVLPEIVLLYCDLEKQDCLNLIKAIRKDKDLKSLSILLVVKNYEQDFILSAYDEGITDYMLLGVDDAEILMRTIWGLKKNSLLASAEKQKSLLEGLGVLDSTTGFYTYEYSDKIFENEFKNLKKSKSDAILILISASEEYKTKLEPVQLSLAIKNSTRKSDVIVHGAANKFYVLLFDTNLKGAFRVIDKIKLQIGEGAKIAAGMGFVGGKSFENLKTELLNSQIEADSTKQDVVIVTEEEKHSNIDWLDKINSTQKNFKLFKQAYMKKLDKVITPVFFQMQKMYEDKLFKTEIEQYSNSTMSAFVLKNEKNISELKITYPGFSKINIDFLHSGLDTPENKRISLDLTELDENKLTKIIEDFVAEFKSSNSLK